MLTHWGPSGENILLFLNHIWLIAYCTNANTGHTLLSMHIQI